MATSWTYSTAAGLAFTCLAAGGAAQAGPLTMTKTVPARQQALASAYWTREKVAQAPALALPVDFGASAVDLLAAAQPSLTGPLGSAAPGVGDPDATRMARAFYAQDWAPAGAGASALDEPADVEAGTSAVYTSYDVGTIDKLARIYPHRWDGKLTFNTPGGGASCSATSISGNNIVTAAHCVYDSTNNVWYSSWVFTPAYRNGTAPFGTFAAQACTILTAYANLSGSYSISTWTRHDVAVCTVGTNSAGQTLNTAVGWAGRLWNAGNNQLVFNSGYPARTYADDLIANGPAQYLRACTAETYLYTTETLGSGCAFGRGISGGSWLVGYKPTVVSGWVNSVNSGLFIGEQNIYGARFNSSNIVPVCNTRGC